MMGFKMYILSHIAILEIHVEIQGGDLVLITNFQGHSHFLGPVRRKQVNNSPQKVFLGLRAKGISSAT